MSKIIVTLVSRDHGLFRKGLWENASVEVCIEESYRLH